MRLSTCLHRFFDEYLPQIKGSSEQSVKAYRETFSMLLPFMAQYHNVKIKSLKIDHLSANLVLSFLNHLETHRHYFKYPSKKGFKKTDWVFVPERNQKSF